MKFMSARIGCRSTHVWPYCFELTIFRGDNLFRHTFNLLYEKRCDIRKRVCGEKKNYNLMANLMVGRLRRGKPNLFVKNYDYLFGHEVKQAVSANSRRN